MWSPTLRPGDAPVYERLVQALAADVAAGAVQAGERLPPQRDLAFQLGVGVGTVTRAYAEAERRGLLRGHVGRGSFVAPPQEDVELTPAGAIDLARNIPPSRAAAAQIAETMTRLSRRPNLIERIGYTPVGGFAADQRAGAQWLSEIADWDDLRPEQLICCAGAQQAVALALGALCRPGDAVICEAATFAGLKALAAHMDYRLVGAAMDDQGLTPEGLDRAAQASGAKAAYVLPVQNPTGVVMGLERRREIIAVARRRGLMLVEDDLFGAYAGGAGLPALTPLAALAPDRVFYVSAVSKSLAPGLRTGWLVPAAGGDWRERAVNVLHAIALGGPSLGAVLASAWIEDGAAQTVLQANRRELAVRVRLAMDILGDVVTAPVMASAPHLWLPMSELAAERLAGRAGRSGVELTPPDGPVVDRSLISGVRLCLGGPSDLAVLERGLRIVKASLGADSAGARAVI